jgi:hypothetical protein
MGINEARRVALRFCRRCTLEVGHAKVGREHTLSFAAFAISIGLVVEKGIKVAYIIHWNHKMRSEICFSK